MVLVILEAPTAHSTSSQLVEFEKSACHCSFLFYVEVPLYINRQRVRKKTLLSFVVVDSCCLYLPYLCRGHDIIRHSPSASITVGAVPILSAS